MLTEGRFDLGRAALMVDHLSWNQNTSSAGSILTREVGRGNHVRAALTKPLEQTTYKGLPSRGLRVRRRGLRAPPRRERIQNISDEVGALPEELRQSEPPLRVGGVDFPP